MRKLIMFEHISLDGVIQGSADENNFPYGDWSAPYRTPAGREALLARYGEKFDLLVGRRTYDGFSVFWPKAPSSPVVPTGAGPTRQHTHDTLHRSWATWSPDGRILSSANESGRAERVGLNPSMVVLLVLSLRRVCGEDGSRLMGGA